MNRVYCLLVCLFCACQVSLCKELDEKVLFEELDQLLAQQQELTQEKERKICHSDAQRTISKYK